KYYETLRKGSFFEGLTTSFLTTLKLLIRYATKCPRYSMQEYFDLNKNTILKIIQKLVERIPSVDFSSNKLVGQNKIIQIDETMLNFKCKSHRGRSLNNRSDSLCIIEFENKITRVFAKVIENLNESTLVPIICSQVASNSIIWTDKHRS
ncbi:hypothetical protein H312_03583, partial [Anncaliia algerae PRA339]